MKIAAELRIKHGQLYESCLMYGGVKAFSKRIGIGYQTVLAWLHLRRCPIPGVYNRAYTKKVERRLERLTGVSVADLFPQQLKAFTELHKPERHVVIRDIDVLSLKLLTDEVQLRLTTSDPVEDSIAGELADCMNQTLKKLPHRLQTVIDCRFRKDMSQEETGNLMGISKGRVSQLEQKAVRLLQQPEHAKKLVEFI